jgi:uncharacterized protein YtpQ (UPF0354 family)
MGEAGMSSGWIVLPFVAAVVMATAVAPGRAEESTIAEPEAFTALLAEAFAKAAPDAKVTVLAPYNLSIVFPPATGAMSIYLNDVDLACRHDPDDCEKAVKTFVAKVMASVKKDKAPIERSAIRAEVRLRHYVDQIREAAASLPSGEPIARPLFGDLWIVCVADRAQGMRLINAGDAASLGLSADEVVALAQANLAATLKPLDAVTRPLSARGFDSVTGDHYTASRLLLHDEWASLAKQMKGGLVVSVPASEYVLYGDSANKETVKEMAAYARHVAGKAMHPISPALLKWTETGWEAVAPQR